MDETQFWGTKAAAQDAAERVGPQDSFFAIWIDDDGLLHYSQANNSYRSYCVMSRYIGKCADACVEDTEE